MAQTTKGTFQTHRIAWEGLSFEVPDNWDLSYHSGNKRKKRIRLEDEHVLRLEVEWSDLSRRPSQQEVRRNYDKLIKPIRQQAVKTDVVEGLPRSWNAGIYQLKDGTRAVTAYWVAPDRPLILLCRMQFFAEDRLSPVAIIKHLAETVQIHKSGLIPWEAYDVKLTIPAEFRLAMTELQAGAKNFTFQWRWRQLHIWQVSLAHLVLKKQPIGEWAAEFLKKTKRFRARRFFPGEHKGHLQVRKSRIYPFGHYDEIGRLCFRYYARYAHDENENRIYLWVFNYRRASDLNQLQGNVGPFDLYPGKDKFFGR